MLRLLFLSIVLPLLAAQVLAADLEKLDGYGGYKFGMTLAEADAVRPDDKRQSNCEYPGVSPVCLIRQTILYGEEAEIVVIFSQEGQRVERIQINFSRLKENTGGACVSVLKTIADPLLQTFGTKYLKVSDSKLKFTWHFPRGGQVELSKLCVSDDVGIVMVIYKQSDAFQ